MTTSGASRRWLQAGTLAAGLGAALAAGTGTACADDDPTWPGDCAALGVVASPIKPSARGAMAARRGTARPARRVVAFRAGP